MALLRVEEVCVRLGISHSALRGLMDDGKIKVTRLGPRIIRIDEGEIQRYLDSLVKKEEK